MSPGHALAAADSTGADLDAQPRFIVRESDAVQALSALFAKVPVERWRAYCSYHYLVNNADVLPQAFDDEAFDFYGRTLHGQQEQRARWKRAARAVDTRPGRGGGRAVRRALLPAGLQAQVLRAGREPARRLRRSASRSCRG